MKRLILLVVSIIVCTSMYIFLEESSKAEAISNTSGTWGDLEYSFDSATGTLSISGSGEIDDANSKAPWNQYREDVRSIIIGGAITSVGKYSFMEYDNLETLRLGSVSTIEDYAFYGCFSLKSVNIPDTATSIGFGTFARCTALTEVTFGNSVNTIDQEAFRNCTSLKSLNIPKSVTNIGMLAFYGCTSLTSIDVEDNNPNYWSDKVALYTKGDAIELVQYPAANPSTTYTVPDTVSTIGYAAFKGCTFLKCVTLPGSIVKINNHAFQNCTSLESISLPDSVTTIGEYAYDSCSSLSSINIPSKITTINWHTFYNCTSLQSITLSDSITSIMPFAFWGCTSLSEIVFGNSLQSVGSYAFSYCTSLTEVTLGESITKFDGSAFYFCISLSSFIVDQKNPNYCSVDGVLFNKKQTELIQYPSKKTDTNYTVPSTVTKICEDAFVGCIYLQSIEVKQNSNYCSDEGVLYDLNKTCLIAYPSGKTDPMYSMPETLERTSQDYPFYGNTNLTEIVVSDSFQDDCVPQLGMISAGCKITINDTNPNIKVVDEVVFSKDGETLLLCTSGKTGEYTIPEGTKKIEKFAFVFAENLVALNIADSVTEVCDSAFQGKWAFSPIIGCKSLCRITFGNGLNTVSKDISFIAMTFTYEGKTVIAPTDLNGKTFSVCNGTLSTGFDPEVPISAHVLTDVPGKAATFVDDGSKAHQHCTLCGKDFIDGKETSSEDLVISAKCAEPGTIFGLVSATILLVVGVISISMLRTRKG